MKFTTTLQKAYKLEANVTGMNIAKNQQIFFEFRKIMRISKQLKNLLLMIKQLQSKHIF